ncbi:DNA translocase FtsK [Gilvibacter sp.]|uniref:DNA translocase FtsK n=1 Tax=Gilvibacter sp. TaxID=2729997 RepID=UPI003B515FCB
MAVTKINFASAPGKTIYMPTAGERQNFLWRPNDNSSTTLARYDLEAEHWVRAFKNAHSKHRPRNYSADLAVVGLFINLFFSLLTVLVIVITDVLKFGHRQAMKARMKREVCIAENIKAEKINKDKINHIIAGRPRTINTGRSSIFKNAAKLVVLKQKVSISGLMYELNLDFEKISKIIDELYEAGIISDPIKTKGRKVLIKNEEDLELLLKLEGSYTL